MAVGRNIQNFGAFMTASRWEKICVGMTLQQVRDVFGDDMWKATAFAGDTWMVNNEADKNPDHGYMVVFDEAGLVKKKGSFSCA